jgi:hypothetical protein
MYRDYTVSTWTATMWMFTVVKLSMVHNTYLHLVSLSDVFSRQHIRLSRHEQNSRDGIWYSSSFLLKYRQIFRYYSREWCVVSASTAHSVRSPYLCHYKQRREQTGALLLGKAMREWGISTRIRLHWPHIAWVNAWMCLPSSIGPTRPITVVAKSEAWTVFARSNTWIVGSNPTRGMDVYVRLFCGCVILCVSSGLAKGWSPVQEVLTTVYSLRNWKNSQDTQGLYSDR